MVQNRKRSTRIAILVLSVIVALLIVKMFVFPNIDHFELNSPLIALPTQNYSGTSP